MTRIVCLEKSWVEMVGAVGFFHYAVKVDDDWYELEAGEGRGKSGSAGRRNAVNGDLNGRPRRDRNRKERFLPALTCAGATDKSDDEILAFNKKWINTNPYYNPLGENCQKYAFDLIRFLVGGSFKMEMPLASVNAWADGPGSHEIHKDGFNQARATTGKAGAQFTHMGAEVEGPSAGVEASHGFVGVDASLVRVEGTLLGAGARLEPNVNTGIGVTGGQFKAKAAGFGFTVGKGFGIHTPLGSLGFGKF